ncbi:PREDICTED: ribonuclease CL2-like [Buceros rhinoceros silvestris]|uniref:ribonuclease CL2-like n=1 Tax=Buceros rhinoceros silvestris TaxID=175836 RepID=UPI00052933E4|nr:PREDICTED: ribonuclease CL2-like [Buceros rhinoceros silvestris]
MTLVLAALAGLVSCQNYQTFLQKHVDNPRTRVQRAQRYCDIMMQRRRVMVRGNHCKPLNTFVHAPARDLVAACNRRPNAVGRHTTRRRLSLTNCRLLRGRNWPRCTYRAQQVRRYVVVNCRNGKPVHLDSTRP